MTVAWRMGVKGCIPGVREKSWRLRVCLDGAASPQYELTLSTDRREL